MMATFFVRLSHGCKKKTLKWLLNTAKTTAKSSPAGNNMKCKAQTVYCFSLVKTYRADKQTPF